MIIINLMGGLGNQMFQYAAAMHLSVIHNTALRIDTSNFRKLTKNRDHIVQLDCFNISAPQASETEISMYKPSESKGRRIMRRIRKTLRLPIADTVNPFAYSEPDESNFKPDFFDLGPDRYLVGYFNSYKYFHPIRDILINEYAPRNEISIKAREMIKQIEDTNSVGVHIRRGDYVTDPDVLESIEGIITDRYYRNAMDVLLARLDNPHFYIFSNDMTWVVDHFRVPARVTYVDINTPQRGFEDLWIMSKCRHNITAGGSTFSWWAAYLNRNADKIVVRTEKISNHPRYDHPEDYFPPEWEVAAS
jgi:hypothetical protein